MYGTLRNHVYQPDLDDKTTGGNDNDTPTPTPQPLDIPDPPNVQPQHDGGKESEQQESADGADDSSEHRNRIWYLVSQTEADGTSNLDVHGDEAKQHSENMRLCSADGRSQPDQQN